MYPRLGTLGLKHTYVYSWFAVISPVLELVSVPREPFSNNQIYILTDFTTVPSMYDFGNFSPGLRSRKGAGGFWVESELVPKTTKSWSRIFYPTLIP